MWCVSISVNCLGTGWLSISHGSCWPVPDVVPCFCLTLLVHSVVPVLEV